MPSALSTILVVFAVTISAVEGSILYGLVPFLLAFTNELLRVIALRGVDDSSPGEDEGL